MLKQKLYKGKCNAMSCPSFFHTLRRFTKAQQKKVYFRGLLSFFFLNSFLLINSANADYILSAPPRENAVLSEQTYEPLAEYLTKVLGEKVVYQKPSGWFDYAQKMRDGKYDIVFDGPHFAAWRLKHLHHIPIVALPGTLDFDVIADAHDTEISKVQDLNGQKICGAVSPHLGTSLVYELFDNPVLQPQIEEVRGGVQEVYKAYKRGQCRAAIMRTVDFEHLPAEEKAKTKIVAKTKSLPNQTITISRRLENNAQKIADFMTSKEGAVAAKGLLSRYSKNAPYFEATDISRYDGIEDLLEGVVWGW